MRNPGELVERRFTKAPLVPWLGLVLLGVASTATASERFTLEFSKSVIYVGESVQANFVLYAREDALDVEVARFPQFRGFWSENMALRQGPMPLLRESFRSELRRAVIGTYVIVPMQGRDRHTIEPMKILVKPLFGRGASDAVALPFESERTSLEIKPLPPFPATWTAAERNAWKGLVGTVTLRADTPTVRFFSGEPTTLRYSVQGEANFAELRELPVPVPADVELLDQRVSLFGSGPLATKIFEITVVPRTDADVTVPPLRLPVFDPSIGSYEVLETEPVRLVREPKPLFTATGGAAATLEKEPRWKLVAPVWRSPVFLAAQAALAAMLATLGFFEWRRRKRRAREADPAYQRGRALRHALACLDRGDRDGFFRAMTPLARASASPSASRLLAHRDALLFGPPEARGPVADDELRAEARALVDDSAPEADRRASVPPGVTR